jgi:hypothetical protein
MAPPMRLDRSGPFERQCERIASTRLSGFIANRAVDTLMI